jgi:Tol biopolymer transport system component/DNA-binding winged helix-turn-helix (wHTH) protein
MDMTEGADVAYEFGPYRLDTARRLLTRDGKTLTLPPKTFSLLLLLIEGQGRVFTKKELMIALWPDSFVEEANLSFQISALRKVLGDEGGQWIATLPRYGYRFSGEVTEIDLNPPEPPDANGHARTEPVPAPASLPVAPPAVTRSRSWIYWIPAALATLAAIVLGVTLLRESPPKERVIRMQISPPDGVSSPDIDSFAVSPDGERLVFIGAGSDGRRQLWLRSLSSLTQEPLEGTELVDSAFWSPDSRSVAFFAAGKLAKIDLQGGAKQTICDTPVGRSTGTWNRAGVILFETLQRPEIYRVSASGGTPAPVRNLDTSNRETRHSAPQFLPDGHHFVYLVQSDRPENNGIYVASLDSTVSKRLVNSNTNAAYAGDSRGASYLLFTRGSNLMGQVLDLSKLELTGAPFQISPGVLIAVGGVIQRAAMSASANGVMAYRTRIDTGSTELMWLDRQGKRISTVGALADYSNPALSPDGKKLAVSRMDEQTRTRDLWLFDLTTGASSRFTFDPADETNPVWSADGSRIAFNGVHNGLIGVFQKPVTGNSEPAPVGHFDDSKSIETWSPDGRYLLVRTGVKTWALPMEDQDVKTLGPWNMEVVRISPNGRWVAYDSNESGRSEVYVQAFPPGQGKWQVSTAGGTEPAWREDGKEMYFVGGDKLIAVGVKTDQPVFETDVSRPLFEVHLESTTRRTRYQVASNGQRFLINLPIQTTTPITVAINWATDLAR